MLNFLWFSNSYILGFFCFLFSPSNCLAVKQIHHLEGCFLLVHLTMNSIETFLFLIRCRNSLNKEICLFQKFNLIYLKKFFKWGFPSPSQNPKQRFRRSSCFTLTVAASCVSKFSQYKVFCSHHLRPVICYLRMFAALFVYSHLFHCRARLDFCLLLLVDACCAGNPW